MHDLTEFLEDYFSFRKWLKRSVVVLFYSLSLVVTYKYAYRKGGIDALEGLLQMMQQKADSTQHDSL